MRLLAILLQLLFMIPLTAQITINGIMDETQYQCLGFFTSGRNGFGTGNDIGCIKYYSNNTTLYIGVTGDLIQDINNNNIVLFMDDVQYNGRGNNPLGGTSTGTFPGVFNTNCMKTTILDAGFDADYAFAFNKGNQPNRMYFDAMRFGTTFPHEAYFQYGNVGFCDLIGNPTTTTLPFCNPAGSCTPTVQISFAFQAGYDPNNTTTLNYGIELQIPYTALPGVTAGHEVRFFAVITNGLGQFSNECIPGDPGPNPVLPCPNLNLSSIPNEVFFTVQGIFLPVQFISFSGSSIQNKTLLIWKMANDAGISEYTVLRSGNGRDFHEIKTIPARQRNETVVYELYDEQPLSGRNYYKVVARSGGGLRTESRVIIVHSDNKAGLRIVYHRQSNEISIIPQDLPPGNYTITLSAMNGQQLFQRGTNYSGGGQIIRLNNLPLLRNGVYLIQISDKQNMLNQKLFVNN